MYPFELLAPALALFLVQVEPVQPAGEGETQVAQETPRGAPEAQLTGEAPGGQASAGRDTAGRPPRARGEAGAEPQGRRLGEPERAQVARAALAFLDALVAADAARLAAASAERFSFDGEVRTGKEEIRRAWRGLLAGRDAAQHATLLDLEILPASEAVSRLGPPPQRLASLAAARGTWVAIANVSRRPVVLFLAREGNRWAVAGME